MISPSSSFSPSSYLLSILRWYLETIYPESQLPLNYHHLGSLSVTSEAGQDRCVDTMGKKAGEQVGLAGCHGLGGNQVNSMSSLESLVLNRLRCEKKVKSYSD